MTPYDKKYSIKIVSYDLNLNYGKELDEFKKRDRFNTYSSGEVREVPEQYHQRTTLEVELNEEEFIAIKKAVLETFK